MPKSKPKALFFFDFNFLSVTLRLTNWVVIAHKNDIARYKVIIAKSEIWGGFGQVAMTGKKLGRLFRAVVSCFQGQKRFKTLFKNMVGSALKSCIK